MRLAINSADEFEPYLNLRHPPQTAALAFLIESFDSVLFEALCQ